MPAEQSSRPEDTRFARENEMVSEEEELVELSLEDIRDCDDDVMMKVPTPEWRNKQGQGGFVYVCNRSGEERNRFEADSARRQGQYKRNRAAAMKDLLERLVVFGACDKSRQPLLKAADIEWLRKRNAGPIGRIADVVLDLNGWTNEDVEQMVGNSKGGPSSTDTSG